VEKSEKLSPVIDTKLDFDSALCYNQSQIDFNHRLYEINQIPAQGDNCWPHDLSRTSDNYLNYSRTNYGSFYNTMKGNLLLQFDPLSPPSSSSSSSPSFIYNHNQSYFDEICDILNDENYNLPVEDAGHYTTLTNASNTSYDLFLPHHDHHSMPRTFTQQNSTSSGGDSRSPDGFTTTVNTNDDYENGIQNFTQLTSLTPRTNSIYASSPVTVVNDGMLSNYDTSVLTPNK
jgi:hypothetical protein